MISFVVILLKLFMKMLGFFLFFSFYHLIGWLSWIGNGVVIILLTKQRKSLEPQDFLTLNLAVSDASIAIFGYSRGILEIFDVFKDEGYIIRTFWTCKVSN